MNTLLYNTITNTAGNIRHGRYIVDGKTGQYPPEYVELIVQEPVMPTYDSKTQNIEYSSYFADIPNLLWTRTISVVSKSQTEIDEIHRQDLINKKITEFDKKVNIGYQIPDTNIYLKIDDQSRIAWNQLTTLLNEMISLGQLTPDTELQIADKNDELHFFTVQQIKSILAGLGYYYYTLWIERNSADFLN